MENNPPSPSSGAHGHGGKGRDDHIQNDGSTGKMMQRVAASMKISRGPGGDSCRMS